MKKVVSVFTVFIFASFMGITYQSCGKDSKLVQSEGTLEVDANESDVKITVDLSNGDSVLYKIAVSDLNAHSSMEGEDLVSSNLISLKFGHYFLESTTYKDDDANTETSCSQSAFPHCLYVNERVEHENIVGYRFVYSPLDCHWQRRLSQDERTSLFAHIQSIKYAVKSEGGTNQPADNKCTLSSLSFNNENESLSVILDYESYKDSVCLPSGTKYASSGNIEELKDFFKTEIDKIKEKKDSEDFFCNNYSAYSPETTSWSYYSGSGTHPGATFRDADYNKENSTVSLSWRETSGGQAQCAENVSISGEELNVFFPEEGLKYKFYYSDGSDLVTGGGAWSITYEDPFDKGNKWTFSGKTNIRATGGAVLQDSQMEDIRTTIEKLINRAKDQNLSEDCAS